MAKIKHISDGVNTWDVGGGTEVFTAPAGLWEMNVTIGSTSVSGSTVNVAESAAHIISPGGVDTPTLIPGQAAQMTQGDTIHITFTGTLPADTIDTIVIGSSGFYTLNLSQAGAMGNSYYATMTTVGYPYSTFDQSAAPANTVYDKLKVVAPLTVTNDGNDDCLGADFNLPDKVEMGNSQVDYGYTSLTIFDGNGGQIGQTSYFNTLVPVIYGTWSNYDSTDECYKGISINDEDDLVNDCILVVDDASGDGCSYAKITFDTALFGTKTVHFANNVADSGNAVYCFTTIRRMYFRVSIAYGDIVLTPIENPSVKYNLIKNATDIDHVNYTPVKDSTATVNQIIGAMLAVYGWGKIKTGSSGVRAYILKNSSDANINPDTTIALTKNNERVECQHFTSPVNGIYKLKDVGGTSILPIKAVSCNPGTSNANLCLCTSAVFYDNQTSAAQRGWKLPQETSWPSDSGVSNYCYNFFIFETMPSGI